MEIARRASRRAFERRRAPPSLEALWDQALDADLLVTAVAVDDAHAFHASTCPSKGRPGKGWVEVFADLAREDVLCMALARGRLYSSSGAKILRPRVSEATFTALGGRISCTCDLLRREWRVVPGRRVVERRRVVYAPRRREVRPSQGGEARWFGRMDPGLSSRTEVTGLALRDIYDKGAVAARASRDRTPHWRTRSYWLRATTLDKKSRSAHEEAGSHTCGPPIGRLLARSRCCTPLSA